MTTVTSKKSGRKYRVESTLYGTRNTMYTLYLGEIMLCYQCGGTAKLRSLEEGIDYADIRADNLGLCEVLD